MESALQEVKPDILLEIDKREFATKADLEVMKKEIRCHAQADHQL